MQKTHHTAHDAFGKDSPNFISSLSQGIQYSWFKAGFVLLIGCLLSAGLGFIFHEETKLKDKVKFELSSHRLANDVRLTLQWHQDALRETKQALHTLIDQNKENTTNAPFSRTQFQQAVEQQHIFKLYPQLKTMAWIHVLPTKNANAFLKAQQQSSPHFQFRAFTPLQNEQMFLSLYTAPDEFEKRILGWNLASEIQQKLTLESAQDHAQTSMSQLLNFSPYQQGLLIAEPVYAKSIAPQTVIQRQESILGFLVCIVHLPSLLADNPEVKNQLLQIDFKNSFPATSNAETLDQANGLATVQAIHLFGSQFQISIRAGNRFNQSLYMGQAFLIFIIGCALSLLTAYRIRNRANDKQKPSSKTSQKQTPNDLILQTLKQHLFVFETDIHGNFTDVNDAFCQISGYSKEQLILQNVLIIASDFHPKEFWLAMWETIKQGKTWREEVCNRNQQGELFWVDQFIIPIFDEHANLEKYIAISIDISASKKAATELENALRESDALLSALNMHAIVSIADNVGKLIDVNPAYCRISGYSRDEIINGNQRLITTGIQSPDFLSHMWRTIASGTPWRGEVCNRNKNGSLYWVDTFIAPFKNAKGQIEKFISIRTDITASKKAASRLASQRSALANIIEGTNVGTWEWNVETGEMRINERWCDQIGYELSELAPVTITTWDGITHPEDLTKAKKQFQMHFKHELPYYEFESRIRHKKWTMGLGINTRSIVILYLARSS